MKRFGAFLLAVLMAVVSAAPARAVSDEEVETTIEAMKRRFYELQTPTGHWEKSEERPTGNKHSDHKWGGETALITYALLVAGDSFQHPKLAKALEWLRKNDSDFTYTKSIRAHIWAHLPDSYLPLLNNEGEWLLTTAQQNQFGVFHYTQKNYKSYDNSTTQYGMLGLWEVAKRGGRIPEAVWRTQAELFLETQNEDGGWAYNPRGRKTRSSNTMACAGLTAMYIIQQQLYRTLPKPNPEFAAAIERGLAFVDKEFRVSSNGYYMYGIERVGLASGRRYFNNKDWYEQGASAIVNRAKDTGACGGNVDSAFFLMFLSRGRYPVWISKLEVPGINWNNKPHDLTFLTDYVSDYRESELNWQVVPILSNPHEWLNSPILYFTADNAFELSEDQRRNLKTYIAEGGTLLCVADGNNGAFTRSVQKLAQEMFPEFKMERAEPNHPMFNVQNIVPNGGGQPIQVLNNGVRDLIILSERDWSMTFQSDVKPGQSPPWQIITNIWTLVSNRGVVPSRLNRIYEARKKVAAKNSHTVARVQHSGNWNAEPAAWRSMGNRLWNTADMDVKLEVVELDKLGDAAAPLAHLAGIDELKLSAADIKAIESYTNRGGTVLVETIGGRGDFASSVEQQLVSHFKNAASPLTGLDPIISGQGLGAGSNDCSRINYRRYAVVNMSVGTRPRLAAINVNDRPAIIISGEDLSAGMVGLNHWSIIGYETESAKRLMANLALFASRQKIEGGSAGRADDQGLTGPTTQKETGPVEIRDDGPTGAIQDEIPEAPEDQPPPVDKPEGPLIEAPAPDEE